MLVLSFKHKDIVRITTPSGEEIAVQVFKDSKRHLVSLGFDAPKSYHILRDDAKVRSPRDDNTA